MSRLLRDFRTNQEGVTVIEYALVGVLISIAALTLLSAIGSTVRNLMSSTNSALTTA